MGSGKTTVGKKLANKLNYNFIDLDAEIEKQELSSIHQIFSKKGEENFRALEHQKLLDLLANKKVVVSCGGGTPCFNNNMEFMTKNGITIYIKLSVEALHSRLKSNKENRPLISSLNDESLKAYIHQKLNEREEVYIKSKIIITGLSVNINDLVTTINGFH